MAEGFNSTLKWTFGLLGASGKYLTAEKFQNAINVNGPTLKSKQIWTMEGISKTQIALKSTYGKYLSAGKDGKLDASGEEIGEDQIFELETQANGNVAILNVKHGRYVGGSGDHLRCYDQVVGALNTFTIHLAMHPQINLRNVKRTTYAHLCDGVSLNCNEEIPWGYDAMIIMEFHGGRYALRAANTRYLRRDGELVDDLDDNSLYTIVFNDAQVAFRDCNGRYLAGVGPSARITSRRDTIGKDELFLIEDSHPQVRLIASNGKYVSIRDGLEVRANHSDVTDAEIFQMEAIDRTDRSGNVKWAFHSNNKKYWNCAATMVSDQPDFTLGSARFSVEWMGPFIALKASNGKYISITPNGQMTAKSAELTDTCKFVFEFINRPILVLRGEIGFVGVKGSTKILECNRSQYDVFGVSGNAGTYNIRSVSGKFWTVECDNSVTASGDKPTDFFFELRAHTHLTIIAPNGKYLKGQPNGGFAADGDQIDSKTLWEY